MEAHGGSIGIGIRKPSKPRSPRLAKLRARIRQRRLQRAERAYSMRRNGISAPSIPGSEHTHLLQHRKGF
jgi:hypothetical protein